MRESVCVTRNEVGVMRAEHFNRLDIVRLASGQELIITDFKPSRPANPWLGVLVNGHGKEYKFGLKHRPTKIGTTTENHPALLAMAGRKRGKAAAEGAAPPFEQGGTTPFEQRMVRQLAALVVAGDMASAKVVAESVLAALGPQDRPA